MCKRNGKTIAHLLLHSPVARDVDYDDFTIWGSLVYAMGVVELLASWLSKFNRHKNVVIWSMICLKGMRD